MFIAYRQPIPLGRPRQPAAQAGSMLMAPPLRRIRAEVRDLAAAGTWRRYERSRRCFKSPESHLGGATVRLPPVKTPVTDVRDLNRAALAQLQPSPRSRPLLTARGAGCQKRLLVSAVALELPCERAV